MNVKHIVKARFNFNHLFHRLSTWLGILAASAGAAAIAFSTLPDAWQATLPTHVGMVFAWVAVGAAALVPIATSFKQKNMEPPRE